MLLIILVLTFIDTTIFPRVNSTSMHVIVEPFALILTPVQPSVDPETLYLILVPFTLVPRPIVPLICAPPVFLTRLVLTVVNTPISPAFFPLTMLKIVNPVSFIPGSIHVSIDSEPVSLVIDPHPFIHISIYMGELAGPVGLVILPSTIVEGTVSPYLFTLAVTETSLPFSLVSGARRLESERSSGLSPSVWVILSVLNCFTLLSESKIARI